MRAGDDPIGFEPAHGLGSDDNPVFHDMHRAAAHVVGATRRGVPPGVERREPAQRQHHRRPPPRDARPGQRLLHLQRRRRRHPLAARPAARTKVAYVDVDVHHGDGVERIFYDDPRVLTISLHETGQTLFPGTGFPQDVGGPDAAGQRGQRRAPARHVGRRLAAGLPRGRAAAAARVRARRAGHPARLRQPPRRPARRPDAERRRPARVVPRAARPGPRGVRRPLGRHRRGRLRPGRGRPAGLDPPAGGRRRPPARPATRRPPTPGASYVRERLGRHGAAPAHRRPRRRRTATGREGYDPGTWLDRTIHATREEIFPFHGLDPLP